MKYLIIANNLVDDKDLIVEDVIPHLKDSQEDELDTINDRIMELNQQGFQAIALTRGQADELFVHLLRNK